MALIQMDRNSAQALEVLPHLRELNGRNEGEREVLELLRKWKGEVARESIAATVYEVGLHYFERRIFSDDLGEPLFSRMNGRFIP